jgi:gluconokinase
MALVLASLRDAGNDVHEVRATGGFARSPLWKQMLTDALGLPVGFAADNEGSALGAALLGMEALGLVESIDVASELVEICEVLRPAEPDAAVYEALGPVFAGLSDALAPAFGALRDRESRLPAAE